ncbi:MAG: hypothetical protein UV28_C0006G0019 [Candidatus Collierbacteria bacterium GW2011_GWE2_42_48]|nr:MAG: hypothetical protein UV28_C0006G0019 [Candidatus Collierbacteria bacterium GW2011_GWE2_42_48]
MVYAYLLFSERMVEPALMTMGAVDLLAMVIVPEALSPTVASPVVGICSLAEPETVFFVASKCTDQ